MLHLHLYSDISPYSDYFGLLVGEMNLIKLNYIYLERLFQMIYNMLYLLKQA